MKNVFLLLLLIPSLCLAFVPTNQQQQHRATTTTTTTTTTNSRSAAALTFPGAVAKQLQQSTWMFAATKVLSPQQENLNSKKVGLKLLLREGFQFLLNTVVSIIALPIALILAAVINHPAVRKALGECVVSGFKDICQDPELDTVLDKAGAILNHDLEEDFREGGKEFPRLLKNFMFGMIGIGS